MTIKINIKPEAIMSKVDRLFNNTPEAFLIEMFQNFRRAGASQVLVSLSDEYLTMQGNGEKLKSFEDLFTLGQSNWDKDVQHEDPAGMGFFSVVMFPEVEVHQDNKCIKVTKEQLLTYGAELQVSESEIEDLTFKFKNLGIVTEEDIKEVAEEYYGIDIYLNKDLIKKYYIGKPIHETEEYKVYYRDAMWGTDILNYFGVNIAVSESEKSLGVIFTAVAKEGCKLKLVLPARNEIIQNEAYENLVKQIDIAVAKFADMCKLLLPYKIYMRLKELYPPLKLTVDNPDEPVFSKLDEYLCPNFEYLLSQQLGYRFVSEAYEPYYTNVLQIKDVKAKGVPLIEIDQNKTFRESIKITCGDFELGEVDWLLADEVYADGMCTAYLWKTLEFDRTDIEFFFEYLLGDFDFDVYDWECSYDEAVEYIKHNIKKQIFDEVEANIEAYDNRFKEFRGYIISDYDGVYIKGSFFPFDKDAEEIPDELTKTLLRMYKGERL